MKTFKNIGAVPSALKMFLRTLSDGWKPSAIRRYASFNAFSIILGIVCLLLTGCVYEDEVETLNMGEDMQMVLTFSTAAQSNSTRAVPDYAEDISNPNVYEQGLDEENYVNILGGDYKIYFFSYNPNATTQDAGTLIAEFVPTETDTTTDATTGANIYAVTGPVPDELVGQTQQNFRIVVLANWGNYPSATTGTTIDELVEGTYTTFNASTKFTIDNSHRIPFYGVQEYTGVSFTQKTIALSTSVSLLRAVAKVEVIACVEQFDADGSASGYGGDPFTFTDVSIVRYNATGYCAPAAVYTADDYDTQMTKNPQTSDWPNEWVDALHLVDEANDSDEKTQGFTKVYDYGDEIGEPLETWRIYLPEYDNITKYSESADDDCCYISVTIGDDSSGQVEPTEQTYEIYFSEYDDNGQTDNTQVANRLNIKRNNIYRFYVTKSDEDNNVTIRVYVIPWTRMTEETFTL